MSLRDVEALFAARGLDVSQETMRRWVLKFVPVIAARLRRTRPTPSDHCLVDELVIVMRRTRDRLWRAVDNEGEFLDFRVQPRRDVKTVKRLMINQLKKQGVVRTRAMPDKLRSYPLAFDATGFAA